MNEPIGAKKAPEVKPWVRRVVEAAGVFMPTNADGERRLGWWGVEMARFLKFCKTLPAETALRPAMEGYGRYLKSSVPPPQDWQLDQAREALRCFQKGTENWHIAAPDAEGRVEVGFRVKTRSAAVQVAGSKLPVSNSPGAAGAVAEAWLEKSSQTMKVRRFALRTVETYLGWQRRFLNWAAEKCSNLPLPTPPLPPSRYEEE